MDRHTFKLNKQYLACERHEKKCVGVFLVKIFGRERATKRKYNSVRAPTKYFNLRPNIIRIKNQQLLKYLSKLWLCL